MCGNRDILNYIIKGSGLTLLQKQSLGTKQQCFTTSVSTHDDDDDDDEELKTVINVQ